MPTVPCPLTIDCPGSDSPLTNFSEEAPDRFVFGAVAYPIFNPHNPLGPDGSGRDTGDPPSWFAEGCVSLCYSVLSQEAADLCAAAEAYICSHTHNPPNNPVLFFNSQQQCAATCPNGSIFVWTVGPGSFVSTSQALADQTAQAFACRKAAEEFFCLGDLHVGACLGIEYNHSLTIFGPNPGPFSILIQDGSLPPGYFMSQGGPGGKTIFIDGTSNTTGDFTFTIKAIDNGGNFITRSYTITVLGITNAGTLPTFTNGTPYSQQLTTGGGTAPFTFGLVDGALPDGLTLSSSGLISGTPTGTTAAMFTVQVTDATGIGCVTDIIMTPGGCPGPDWSSIVWGPFQGVFDAPTGTFVGGDFSYAAAGTSVAISHANITGTVSYNGPAANCNLNLSAAAAGASLNAGSVTVQIAALGFSAGIGQIPFGGNQPPGTYDFPFAVPDTGGVPLNISIVVTWNGGNLGFSDGSVNGTGKFTNVC